MTKWLLIAGGGALGSVLRYAIQGWVQRAAAGSFPAGTLAVNVIGCAAIGFLTALFTGPFLIREEYRIGLTVGILGGFTTFSTFGLESFTLMNAGQLGLMALNIILSCVLGLIAVWAGYRVGEFWYGV
jgi:CrcB protein